MIAYCTNISTLKDAFKIATPPIAAVRVTPDTDPARVAPLRRIARGNDMPSGHPPEEINLSK